MVGVMETMEYLFLDERDWVTAEREGSSKVRGLSVEVIRMVTDATSTGGEGVRDGTFG